MAGERLSFKGVSHTEALDFMLANTFGELDTNGPTIGVFRYDGPLETKFVVKARLKSTTMNTIQYDIVSIEFEDG